MSWVGDFEQAIAAAVVAHRNWAGPIAFLLAFGESLAFLSLLLPATAALALMGALVGQGVLDFWWIAIWAIPGAAVGDSVSYWLGRRLDNSIAEIWPFARYPEKLAQGRAFFHRFGTASVFLGRFFGSIRAVISLVAGTMCMPKLQFNIANWVSACIWAPYWLLVGWLGQRTFQLLRAQFGLSLALGMGVLLIVAYLLHRFWRFQNRSLGERTGSSR